MAGGTWKNYYCRNERKSKIQIFLFTYNFYKTNNGVI